MASVDWSVARHNGLSHIGSPGVSVVDVFLGIVIVAQYWSTSETSFMPTHLSDEQKLAAKITQCKVACCSAASAGIMWSQQAADRSVSVTTTSSQGTAKYQTSAASLPAAQKMSVWYICSQVMSLWHSPGLPAKSCSRLLACLMSTSWQPSAPNRRQPAAQLLALEYCDHDRQLITGSPLLAARAQQDTRHLLPLHQLLKS